MRKKLSLLILFFALIFSFPTSLYAANKVPTIDINAVIMEDGSMEITQTWTGTFDEGTEVYIPMNTPDYISISNLTVSDQNGVYDTVPEWNLDWSFEEKSKKSGIHPTDDGYELCFGISQYGENTYKITYLLSNVVGGYEDKDGVNFRFVNDNMNTTPTDVNLEISLADSTPITSDIAGVWGFGFEGDVGFTDGVMVAHTNTPISEYNNVTILLSFEKGLLSPSRQESRSFDEIKNKAFEGSDYDNPTDEDVSIIDIIITLFLSFGLPIGIVMWLIKKKKKKANKKLKKFSENFGYFRDLPNEGNLSATYSLARIFEQCDDAAILATGMLRLIQIGCLSPESSEEVGFMGKTKEVVKLRLMGSLHEKMDEYDEYLYTILESAAGADKILQAKELEHFASENDSLLRTYIEKHNSSGKAYLNKKTCFKHLKNPAKLKYLTQVGEQELGELMGFKRYLEDFSLIDERGVNEIVIWKELLSYAMLFGIADQVAEQMKALYPELSLELTEYSQSMTAAYSYHYLLYKNMKQAEEQRIQEQRSSGGGGFSSFGGGGGSIGGGSGGGTR